jgi:cold shock CspA family protein
MATGIIKSIRGDRGTGIIQRDGNAVGNRERLFHLNAVQDMPSGGLREGQRVSYTEERDPRVPNRFRAISVRLLVE